MTSSVLLLLLASAHGLQPHVTRGAAYVHRLQRIGRGHAQGAQIRTAIPLAQMAISNCGTLHPVRGQPARMPPVEMSNIASQARRRPA